jgi:hypothetical protein
LWERAARRFNVDEWVRGEAATPHPNEFVERLVMPSPTRGDGTTTTTAFSASLAES